MIKVIVELHPGGAAALRRTLALMEISNDSDLAPVSNYLVTAWEGASSLTGAGPRSTTGAVTGHERAESVLSLVAAAIGALRVSDGG